MTASISRSALIFYGFNPAPSVAGMHIDERGQRRLIYWTDVMAERRKRQAERLRRKREDFVKHIHAYRLLVAYYDQDLMGGWQAMIEDWRGRDFDVWIDRDRKWLRPMLMEVFPVVLPIGCEEKRWEMWKPAFAQQFRRRMQDGEPVGVAYVLWDRSGMPAPINLSGK